jgi:chemotaxis methyl-accepting protein methylase
MTIPTPININNLSDVELDAFIASRRERRLALRNVYEASQKALQLSKDEKLTGKLTKKLATFNTKMLRVDALLDELDNRVNEILTLRLEIGDTSWIDQTPPQSETK